jgi:hypothetical protein
LLRSPVDLENGKDRKIFAFEFCPRISCRWGWISKQ